MKIRSFVHDNFRGDVEEHRRIMSERVQHCLQAFADLSLNDQMNLMCSLLSTFVLNVRPERIIDQIRLVRKLTSVAITLLRARNDIDHKSSVQH